ncbi:hypothetical protein DFJ73DRAFT_898090 [Zopfochytrium polystomum]|nr:hypothetical protein DFJ73DRAFT_898090 [Zopfochytrium polystomum]
MRAVHHGRRLSRSIRLELLQLKADVELGNAQLRTMQRESVAQIKKAISALQEQQAKRQTPTLPSSTTTTAPSPPPPSSSHAYQPHRTGLAALLRRLGLSASHRKGAYSPPPPISTSASDAHHAAAVDALARAFIRPISDPSDLLPPSARRLVSRGCSVYVIRSLETTNDFFDVLARLGYLQHARVVGFDLEYVSGCRIPALVQVAFAANLVAIFQTFYICGKTPSIFPLRLKQFIESPHVCKVGVGIGTDASTLEKHYKVKIQNMVDLSETAFTFSGLRRGLTALYYMYVSPDEILKPVNGRTGYTWHERDLSASGVVYAANDALASLLIFRKMFNSSPFGDPPWIVKSNGADPEVLPKATGKGVPISRPKAPLAASPQAQTPALEPPAASRSFFTFVTSFFSSAASKALGRERLVADHSPAVAVPSTTPSTPTDPFVPSPSSAAARPPPNSLQPKPPAATPSVPKAPTAEERKPSSPPAEDEASLSSTAREDEATSPSDPTTTTTTTAAADPDPSKPNLTATRLCHACSFRPPPSCQSMRSIPAEWDAAILQAACQPGFLRHGAIHPATEIVSVIRRCISMSQFNGTLEPKELADLAVTNDVRKWLAILAVEAWAARGLFEDIMVTKGYKGIRLKLGPEFRRQLEENSIES